MLVSRTMLDSLLAPLLIQYTSLLVLDGVAVEEEQMVVLLLENKFTPQKAYPVIKQYCHQLAHILPRVPQITEEARYIIMPSRN